jgi:hypothetical protein
MFRKCLYVVLFFSFLGLMGCATNASVDQMVYYKQDNKSPKNKFLMHSVSVKQVTGGQETNPLWTSKINNENFRQALVKSLQQANLYNSSIQPRYALNAELKMLDQPIAGFDMTASCQVHYTLHDIKQDKIIYDEDILASYTARMGDAFIGTERLKKATEGAAKANIQKLIEALYQQS